MITLYHAGVSVSAAKVRMTLAEKEIAYEGKVVDLNAGDQFSDDYRKLNPKAVVPTLVHDAKVLTESTAICAYLDATFPEPALLAADPEVAQWTALVDSAGHPACFAVSFMTFRHQLMRAQGEDKLAAFLEAPCPPGPDPAAWERRKELIRDGIDAAGATEAVQSYADCMARLNDALAGRSWLVRDTFSMADVAWAPYVNRLAMLGFSGIWENDRLPHLAAWWENVRQRPSFATAVSGAIAPQIAEGMAKLGGIHWPDVARMLAIS